MATNENQSWTQDEFETAPGTNGQGSGTKYGIHAFDSLPTDVQNAALSAYVAALNKGWQVPEAESIAREAASRLYEIPGAQPTVAQPAPAEPETDDQPETPRTMPKAVKIAFWAAVACFVAYFALQAFLGPATPLQAAITARSKAAVTLADATAKANAANAALSSAKARYEAAYKREACIVDGTCIPKK